MHDDFMAAYLEGAVAQKHACHTFELFTMQSLAYLAIWRGECAGIMKMKPIEWMND